MKIIKYKLDAIPHNNGFIHKTPAFTLLIRSSELIKGEFWIDFPTTYKYDIENYLDKLRIPYKISLFSIYIDIAYLNII